MGTTGRTIVTRVEAALYCHRFDDIISGAVDPQDVANRPHVRFDGRTLSEIGDQRSAHAQNDALVRYFAAIRFWQDEDSGSERMRR